MLKAESFLRGPADGALRLLGEALKSARIPHRQVGQNLAVEFDSRNLQTVNELVVAHSIQLGSGADTHNPQRAILPLALLAAGVSELEATLDGFFRGTVE